ncbi:hypothetical protein ACH429_15110 [Streptomyces pathocidini]|uniref:Integral membrane protein n=1 Tax=Streptomyces pathocidini TaxID=1650571 RepID=A0ABW7UV16_9ACTN
MSPPPVAETEAQRLKERIYATITMLAVVVGLTEWDDLTYADTMAVIVATALGLWLASLVADAQAHRAIHARRARRQELRRMLHVSSPLLLSAVGPLVMTGLAALGVFDLDDALLLAAGVETASLFAWGYIGGRRVGGNPLVALVAGGLDMAIGLFVASVKLAAGH